MDKQIDDGGPAFPATVSETGVWRWPKHQVDGKGFVEAAHESPGMSLRDYFAAKAMQAIIAHSELVDENGNFTAEPGKGYPALNNFAAFAYMQADAMLEARREIGQ